FDVSVWELFWPLQVGARLALAEPGGHRDPAYLAVCINDHDVTTLHFVPSMLQLFVDEPTARHCRTIRRIVCSGEALPRSLQDRTFEVLDTELHNLYGPTEAAVDVTWWECDADSPLPTVPIGRPIANTEIHVLDRRLRRVPVGVTGELHIGGVQLARGYHNRRELTAERFVPDPYTSRPGGRLYKTGDLVRHLPDGAVDFLGRLDHQVKIRGQRIELGEIEAVIADHPSIREAIVIAHGNSAAETQLVAYAVGDTHDLADHEAAEVELRRHCERMLAPHMVPSVWMFLASLPLSPNGKVDRRSLPEPTRRSPSGPSTATATATEAEVLEVWQTLLGDTPIGTNETFFDVGGNSLLLVRLSQLLTARYGRNIAVPQLLRHPTISQQANLVEGKGAGPVDDAVVDGAATASARRRARSRRR
ncbi:MAG: non-ribosomal peptide synthetase, partial [Acidimicrobiales bacterium]